MRRRRNGMTVDQFAAWVAEMGEPRTAELVMRYANDPEVAPILAQVIQAVAEILDVQPEAVRSTPDAEMWRALAALVPRAFGGQYGTMSEADQQAIIEAFLAEAARAA